MSDRSSCSGNRLLPVPSGRSRSRLAAAITSGATESTPPVDYGFTLNNTLRAACSVFFPSCFARTANGWSIGFTHGSA